uniref:Uncharacterized protein n=1 Tax=Lotharella globosa TaxID=91324 RepID=A0A6V3QJ58_9EUKA
MLHAGTRPPDPRGGLRRPCFYILAAMMALWVALRGSSGALLGRVPGVKITREDPGVVPLFSTRGQRRGITHHHPLPPPSKEGQPTSDDYYDVDRHVVPSPRRSIVGGALAGAGLAVAQALLMERPAKSMTLESAGSAEIPLCPFLRKRILIDVRTEKEAEEIGFV